MVRSVRHRLPLQGRCDAMIDIERMNQRANDLTEQRDEAERQVHRLVGCIVHIGNAFDAENATRLGYGGVESPHTDLSEAISTARAWISDAAYRAVAGPPVSLDTGGAPK